MRQDRIVEDSDIPTPSSRQKGWLTLRAECPVNIFPSSMFHQAKMLERDIESLERNASRSDALDKTLKAKSELGQLVNTIKRSTDPKYEEATEYEPAAQAFFRLIDMNLRFHRYAEIEKTLDNAIQNNGFNSGKLHRAIQGLGNLLRFLKKSIEQANYRFYDEPEDEREGKEKVIYIVLFAQQLEASLRYTAKYKSEVADGENGEGGSNIQDYYAVIESASAADAVEKATANEAQEQLNEEAEEDLNELFEEDENL